MPIIYVFTQAFESAFYRYSIGQYGKVPEDYMDPEIYDEYLVQVAHDFNGLRNEGCRVISTDFWN